ncbi:hypothetical protein ACO2Q3_03030 [Caulobacter sp. KR2-114]|uniref:hypothetical protein n=1 Tax=Caulobacter sp. KR2-114 TaxID=3400912 RepID=UPI003C11CC61
MSDRPGRILLQTTIPTTVDDWSIARFSRLAALLAGQRDEDGRPLYDVVARDRGPVDRPDPVLSSLDQSDFDQLWLFAVDTGDGLTPQDCDGISRFRARGGGLLVTRDHMDLGSSVCSLGGIGQAHYFHSTNPDPDPGRRQPDDPFTPEILWPNFHSGRNGDFQEIEVIGAPHPVLADDASPTGAIRRLPAHPHEGGIGAPAGVGARVIARGTSQVTGARFNVAVAFEPGEHGGPGIAQSTFHHFADYNWDPGDGCPSFVSEPPGDGLRRVPEALADTRRYMLNLAAWLSPAR